MCATTTILPLPRAGLFYPWAENRMNIFFSLTIRHSSLFTAPPSIMGTSRHGRALRPNMGFGGTWGKSPKRNMILECHGILLFFFFLPFHGQLTSLESIALSGSREVSKAIFESSWRYTFPFRNESRKPSRYRKGWRKLIEQLWRESHAHRGTLERSTVPCMWFV